MCHPKKENSLDEVIKYIGEFGRYQMFVFYLICFAVVIHSSVHNAFVFTALDFNYRCEIPECEASETIYEPAWLQIAVPYKDQLPEKCYSYKYLNTSSDDYSNATCSPEHFNTSYTVKCSSFIYETNELSILQEYGLQCDDNLWKLSMVGTVNGIGQFFGLFLGGFISDKYGRKFVLINGMIISAIFALFKTIMPTYEWFLVFEFLDAVFNASIYICGYVLGVELVGPKKRAFMAILTSSSYAFGEMFTAASAWAVQSWKPLIFILYSPSFLAISYIWLVPESVRWLLSKGREEEAKEILRKAAKFNGKELSESTLEKLSSTQESTGVEEKTPILQIFKSTILSLRLITCSFCWISCAFLFYGLTLNSVSLVAGNSYLDFMLASLIEIPAYICCQFMLDLMGRRKALCASYIITGIACAAFIFVPSGSRNGSLALYLIGKFGATLAFTNLYVSTSEMFPTKMRHTFMGICSTIGRLGSIIAPQAPLLAQLWSPLPLLTFAIMAALAALLCLFFPETSNIKLPDTIEEAENISKLQNLAQDKHNSL